LLNLMVLGLPLVACVRASRARARAGLVNEALLGLSLVASATAFLITCIFGSYLTNEWAFWISALMLKYAELPAAETVAAGSEVRSPGEALRAPPALAGV
jgi:hypothetical protein